VMSRSRPAPVRLSPAAGPHPPRRPTPESRTEHEPSLHVAADQTVVLQRHREPVCGRAGQPGRRRRDRPGSPARTRARTERELLCRERRLR
jgi:hypothetical protein